MPFPYPSYDNADRRALADLFQAISFGEMVSYDRLSQAVGSPILHRRHLIYDAMKLARDESGAIFGVVRGEGYVRLRQEEAHVIGSKTRRHIRRTTREKAKYISRAVEVANDIPMEAKLKAYTELNVLGLIGHLSRDKVAAKTTQEPRPVPVGVAMRAVLSAL